MRIGLIGGGSISETHARAAASIPGVELVAIGPVRLGTPYERLWPMDEQARTLANLDHDERVDAATVGRPLDQLVERKNDSDSVDSPDRSAEIDRTKPVEHRSTEYAEGTTEHEDDHEA